MAQESATNQAWRKWLSGAAIGAVAMYLSDPDRGKRRRALAGDKMRSLALKTGDAIESTSRDLGNRMQGLRARTRRLFLQRNAATDDQILVERARSKIGRAVSHPHAITVAAQQGRVVLSGPILAAEKQRLLELVWAVPGVAGIEDRLDVHERPEGIQALQGGRAPRQAPSSMLQSDWPPAWRAAAALGGSVLGYYGMRRRTPLGSIAAAVGIGLLARSAFKAARTDSARLEAGLEASEQTIDLEKSIYIAAPPESVFDIWAKYENFPHFTSNVREVTDLGNGRSHWIVSGPAGLQLEWNAVLTEAIRPEILAWATEPDSPVQHTGRIRFEPAGDGTRVSVHMSYRPPAGVLGHAAASLFDGNPKQQLEDDLLRMKTFVESGTAPHDAVSPGQAPGAILH
jgi:uncharacterized membrane protein/gas vesicle protein